jgi:hypothetical protein
MWSWGAILRFENGGNWDANRNSTIKKGKNKGKTTTVGPMGIASFTKAFVDQINLKRTVKLTFKNIADMTEVQQLDLVGEYVKWATNWKGSIKTFSDFYMAIHNPAYIGSAENTAIHVKGGKGYYNSNSGLDTDNNCIITKSEAAATAYQWYSK